MGGGFYPCNHTHTQLTYNLVNITRALCKNEGKVQLDNVQQSLIYKLMPTITTKYQARLLAQLVDVLVTCSSTTFLTRPWSQHGDQTVIHLLAGISTHPAMDFPVMSVVNASKVPVVQLANLNDGHGRLPLFYCKNMTVFEELLPHTHAHTDNDNFNVLDYMLVEFSHENTNRTEFASMIAGLSDLHCASPDASLLGYFSNVTQHSQSLYDHSQISNLPPVPYTNLKSSTTL